MKKHLVFILVFLLVVPIWTIGWVWNELLENERDAVRCRYEQTLMEKELDRPVKIHYAASDIPGPDYAKNIGLIALSFSFFIFGGYFFWEYLRGLGETSQKVSFVNQVSHELKTPLTNIRLHTELLQQSLAGDDAACGKLSVIEQETRRLTRLVDNVLMFSYGTRLELKPEDQDVDALIMRIAEGFRPRFEQKGITMELACEAGRTLVDQGVLEQILVNLIGNVEKYAAKGGYIGIEAGRRDGRVYIRVRDRGPGIPGPMKGRVFRPFIRGDDSLTAGAGGIGIGLPLAANLANLHGGELKLLETENGCCFEVIL